jgi:hypothetical protein
MTEYLHLIEYYIQVNIYWIAIHANNYIKKYNICRSSVHGAKYLECDNQQLITFYFIQMPIK